MPGTPDLIRKNAAASTYHVVSGASTNAASVKGSAGLVTGYYLVNTAATFRYVKLFNVSGSPNVGGDTPRCVYGIPPTSAANMVFTLPVAFETGIGIAIVSGIQDSDATAVAANDVSVTLHYL